MCGLRSTLFRAKSCSAGFGTTITSEFFFLIPSRRAAISAETGFGKFNEVASSVRADCGSGLRASGNVPKVVRIAP